jgi:hypothetical protein
MGEASRDIVSLVHAVSGRVDRLDAGEAPGVV